MRPKDWQAHISTPDAFDEAPDTARMPSVTTPEESRKDTVDADDGRTTRRNPAPHYEDARTHDDSRAPRARHLQHAHARVGPTSSTGPGERAPRGRARALEATGWRPRSRASQTTRTTSARSLAAMTSPRIDVPRRASPAWTLARASREPRLAWEAAPVAASSGGAPHCPACQGTSRWRARCLGAVRARQSGERGQGVEDGGDAAPRGGSSPTPRCAESPRT